MKCSRFYGRKNYAFFKEKSFIRDFFYENETSTTSAIDTHVKKTVQSYSYSEQKDDILKSLCSPVLFEHSSSNAFVTNRSTSDQKGIKPKKTRPTKRIKIAKQGRNVKKRKPKQVQKQVNKYCKSFPQRWSQFYNHNFVFENVKTSHFFSSGDDKYLVSMEFTPALHESQNETDVEFRFLNTNKALIPKSIETYIHDDFDYLRELFLTPTENKILPKLIETYIHHDFDYSRELFLTPPANKIIPKSTETYIHDDLDYSRELFLTPPSNKIIPKSTETYIHDDFDYSRELFLTPPTNKVIQNSEFMSINRIITTENYAKTRRKSSEYSVKRKIQHTFFPGRNKRMKYLSSKEFTINDKHDSQNCKKRKSFTQENSEEELHVRDLKQQCNTDSVILLERPKNNRLQYTKKALNDIPNSDNQTQNCGDILSNISRKENHVSNPCENWANTSKWSKVKSNAFIVTPSFQILPKYDSFNYLGEAISFNKAVNNEANEKSLYNNKITDIACFSPTIFHENIHRFVTSTPVIKNKIPANGLFNHIETSEQINENAFKHFSSDIENVLNIHENTLTSNHIRQSASMFKSSGNSGKIPNSLIVENNIVNNSSSSETSRSLLNILPHKGTTSEEDPDAFRKAKLLDLCNQEFVESFSDIYTWNSLKVKKIGEGTYGEVFMITKGRSLSVLKVIPVSEDSEINDFQNLRSVLSEIQISKCLSELRSNRTNQTKNFAKVKRVSVVCGPYPSKLIEAWDDFTYAKSCYNNRPDIYGDSQLFVILELEYGGKDMSCFGLRNALEAESVLKQITVSLAIAEEEFLFEHRDLHLGNILVERKKQKRVSYKLRGKDISFACHGLHVTVIDFTLSRLYKDGYIYYYDLAEDLSLFEQCGDNQFDVYKSMRKHLENKWEECSLHSNVLWLKYLCTKMMESSYSRPSTEMHKKGLKSIETFSLNLMSCGCAMECLTKCGITTIAFDKLPLHSDICKNSILVSRNSIQKSKISI